jgi:hypothetical protein
LNVRHYSHLQSHHAEQATHNHSLACCLQEQENSRLVDIIQGLQQRLAAAEAAAAASSCQQASAGDQGAARSQQQQQGAGPSSSAAAGAELVRAAEAVLAKAQQLQQAANTDLVSSPGSMWPRWGCSMFVPQYSACTCMQQEANTQLTVHKKFDCYPEHHGNG